MSNKEIVQQGLNARKDVRAAEARAEKYREERDAANDARFYDRLSWKAQQATMQREKEILVGVVNRQRVTILQLKDEKAALLQRERLLRRCRVLTGIAKAATIFFLTIWFKRLGWVAPNLALSLLMGSAAFVCFAVYTLARNK